MVLGAGAAALLLLQIARTHAGGCRCDQVRARPSSLHALSSNPLPPADTLRLLAQPIALRKPKRGVRPRPACTAVFTGFARADSRSTPLVPHQAQATSQATRLEPGKVLQRTSNAQPAAMRALALALLTVIALCASPCALAVKDDQYSANLLGSGVPLGSGLVPVRSCSRGDAWRCLCPALLICAPLPHPPAPLRCPAMPLSPSLTWARTRLPGAQAGAGGGAVARQRAAHHHPHPPTLRRSPRASCTGS